MVHLEFPLRNSGNGLKADVLLAVDQTLTVSAHGQRFGR